LGVNVEGRAVPFGKFPHGNLLAIKFAALAME
jgi:hypothetical protein